MEIIESATAGPRFTELLERVARGGSVQITRDDRPIARLVPDHPIDRRRSRAAAERLKRMRGMLGHMSREELIMLKHEGHR